MSTTLEIVQQAYDLARRGDHRHLRQLIAAEATWHPAREGAWSPCSDADEIVKTLMWRSGSANRLRPGETIELGDRVLIQLRGRRLDRLGAKGFMPRLFQIVEVRDGQIARMQDYPRRDAALAAAGLRR
ncbi:MAG TPA: nuclear transport factor 2 family protein [Gaiellaceae bacterium]|nr:nuclear transport factor 2 family protein [Gaiellaceae bacterium]